MVVTESNSSLLESKIYARRNDDELKFEYFNQKELEGVVIIMYKMSRDYDAVCMANMISPKVGLTAKGCKR